MAQLLLARAAPNILVAGVVGLRRAFTRAAVAGRRVMREMAVMAAVVASPRVPALAGAEAEEMGVTVRLAGAEAVLVY